MSRIVDRVPSRGVYPWDRWFDGELRELTRGEDFHCTPHNFHSSVRSAVQSRGLEIETYKIRRNKVYLRVKGST